MKCRMSHLTPENWAFSNTFAVQAIYVDLLYTRDSPEIAGRRWEFSGVARNRGTTWWIDNFAFLFRHWARDTCVESCSHHYSHSSWSWDLKELHDVVLQAWNLQNSWVEVLPVSRAVFKVRRIASSEVLHPPQDSIAVLRGWYKDLKVYI